MAFVFAGKTEGILHFNGVLRQNVSAICRCSVAVSVFIIQTTTFRIERTRSEGI